LFRELGGETYADKTLQQKHEMFLPERITIGLGDHFQAVPNLDESLVYHSSTSNLAVRLFVQNVQQGFSKPIFDERMDSKDPALSPRGGRLAFTSFGKDSRGDICGIELSDKKLKCFTGRLTEDHQPFWIDENRIGFLTRTRMDEAFSVAILHWNNGETQSPQVLLNASISDPSLSPSRDGKRWLAVTRQSSNENWIEIYPFQESESKISLGLAIQFRPRLSGLSSFHHFDPEGQYLYFGQYANDTNIDFQVDARDRSSVYRVLVSDIVSAGGSQDVIPEPLTSLDMNCNYPRPGLKSLYLTCASPSVFSEGVLDVYRLPLSGMLPPFWKDKNLLRAVETARSYSDRNLFLGTLRARYPEYRTRDLEERMLSNAVMDKQWTAALFYLKTLKGGGDKNYYEALSTMLLAFLRKSQAGDENLSATSLRELETAAQKLKSQSPYVPLALASVQWAIGREDLARKFFNSSLLSQIKPSLLLHLGRDLERRLGLGSSRVRHLAFAGDSRFPEPSRIYHAYEWIRSVDEDFKSNEAKSKHLRAIKISESSMAKPIRALEQRLMAFSSDDVKDSRNQEEYKGLLKVLKNSESNYFLHRALLVRSILHFSQRGFWNYMSFISSRWVNEAKTEDSEYSYARKQFLNSGLERAYGRYQDKKLSSAADQFGITARLTDDLEAHHGVVRSRVEDARSTEIESFYDQLEKQEFIGENRVYVRALLESLLDKSSMTEVMDRLQRLEGMRNRSFNQAPRLFLMGTLAHQIFAAKPEQKDFFEKANRYYRLAIDLSTQNERLTIPVLFNLARLHQLARNHGQSLAFFELRINRVFDSLNERRAFDWFYSEALYFNRLPKLAFDYLSDRSKLDSKLPLSFWERMGFYAQQAELYEESRKAYEVYLQKETPQIQTQSSYAFVLFKLKYFKESAKAFVQVLNSKSEGSAFSNRHYHFLAYGFLAQIDSSKAMRIQHLLARQSLLRDFESDLDSEKMKREDWLRYQISLQHQLAAEQSSTKDRRKHIEGSVGLLEELLRLSKNPLEDLLGSAAKNLWTLQVKSEALENLTREILKAAEGLPDLLEREPYLGLRKGLSQKI